MRCMGAGWARSWVGYRSLMREIYGRGRGDKRESLEKRNYIRSYITKRSPADLELALLGDGYY